MPDSTVCANIGPLGRQRRLRSGIRWLAIGGGAGVALALAGAPRWMRLGAFAPFVLGASGVFQAYEQTCVALAARGVRDMDSGEEQIADQAMARQISRQARNVYVESGLLAALLTAAVLALPRRRGEKGRV